MKIHKQCKCRVVLALLWDNHRCSEASYQGNDQCLCGVGLTGLKVLGIRGLQSLEVNAALLAITDGLEQFKLETEIAPRQVGFCLGSFNVVILVLGAFLPELLSAGLRIRFAVVLDMPSSEKDFVCHKSTCKSPGLLEKTPLVLHS